MLHIPFSIETYLFDPAIDPLICNREDFLRCDWNGAYEYCTKLFIARRYEEAVRLCQFYVIERNTAMPGWRRLTEPTLCKVAIVPSKAPLGQFYPAYVSRDASLIVKISSNLCEVQIPKIDVIGIGLFRYFMAQLLLDWIAMRTRPGKSLVLAFSLVDQGGANCAAMCSNDLSPALFPDYDFMCSDGYAHVVRDVEEHWIAWRDRKDTAFWRGAASGYYRHELPPETPEADFFTRGWLARLGQRNMDRMDVGISGAANLRSFIDSDLVDDIENSLGAPPCTLLDFINYKYTFDVDGWGSAFSGLFTKLLMGGVVLKIDSARGYRQWYYNRMRPFVHYIPCRRTEESVMESLAWSRDHPDLAEAISRNARQLALSIDFETEIRSSIELLESAAIGIDAAAAV